MGALAMSTEPQTGSVTMLRKPSNGTEAADVAQTEPPKPNNPPIPPVSAQEVPSVAPGPGLVRRVARSKALWAGAAIIALVGVGASVLHVGPSPRSAQHGPTGTKAAVATGATANNSGITPPDLGMPPARPTKQAPTPATNTASVTPTSTATTPLAVAPVTAPSPPVAPSAAVSAAPTAAEEIAPPDTRPEQPAPHSVTSGEDQLFMEMSRKLTEMTNRIDTLEQKLDANQHALHDQVVAGLGNVGGRLDELRHREDTLEATQNAHTAPAPAPVPSSPARNSVRKTVDVTTTHRAQADAPPAEHAAPRPHYTVQAGAPDIAILESPQGQPVRVQPGSMLDGWGAVTAITQSGSGWVVHTEHGTIR